MIHHCTLPPPRVLAENEISRNAVAHGGAQLGRDWRQALRDWVATGEGFCATEVRLETGLVRFPVAAQSRIIRRQSRPSRREGRCDWSATEANCAPVAAQKPGDSTRKPDGTATLTAI